MDRHPLDSALVHTNEQEFIYCTAILVLYEKLWRRPFSTYITLLGPLVMGTKHWNRKVCGGTCDLEGDMRIWL